MQHAARGQEVHASAQGQERDARAGEPEGEAERVGGGQAMKAAEGARAEVARAGAKGEGVAAVGGAQRREGAIGRIGVPGIEVGGREGAVVAPGVTVDGRREVGEVAEATGLVGVDPPIGQALLRAGAAGGRGRVGVERGKEGERVGGGGGAERTRACASGLSGRVSSSEGVEASTVETGGGRYTDTGSARGNLSKYQGGRADGARGGRREGTAGEGRREGTTTRGGWQHSGGNDRRERRVLRAGGVRASCSTGMRSKEVEACSST